MAGVVDRSSVELVAGKYRVLMPLGQGGTADVDLAVAEGPGGLNKLVVLKRIKAALVSDDQVREMFVHEARLCARLNHPNAVQVLEVAACDGLPVIVMEYLDGRSLAATRARAQFRLNPEMQVLILADALGALHHAHELTDYDGRPLRVVHRDMTPQNVFLTFDGHVKLLDFGIAKLNDSLINTQAGVVKGKLRYMPPEQITGAALDRRTDVFAAGVILWEALTGARLWDSLPDATIMNRILAGDIPRPSAVNQDVSPALEAICLRALAGRPCERYQTAEALQLALLEALEACPTRPTRRDLCALMSSCFAAERERTRCIIQVELGHVSLGDPERAILRMSSTSEAPTAEEAAAHAAGPRWYLPRSGGRWSGASWALPIALGGALGLGTLFGFAMTQRSGGATSAGAAAQDSGAELELPTDVPGPGAPLGAELDSFPHQGVRTSGAATAGSSGADLAAPELRGAAGARAGRPIPGIPGTTLPAASSAPALSAGARGTYPEGDPRTAHSGAAAAGAERLAGSGAEVRPGGSSKSLDRRSVPAAESVPRGRAPSGDLRCVTPYYVDERGIKRFDPNCF